MSKPGSPRHIDNLLREAVELQQNGALEEAEATYREILALRPRHFDAMQLLGALALQAHRYEEGASLLMRALEIDGRQAPVHSNLAYALNALGRHDAALAAANRALVLKSGFVDALNNRGIAQAGLDHPLDALASFEKALSVKPEFAEAWSNRSCALRDLGLPEDALASCDRALALRPHYAEAWSNRANALSDLNRPLDAQASYERALAASPDFADAWNNLGLTYIDMNRHADALACYERALALSPDSAETHWNRALCLLQMGDLAAGFAEYEWRWRRKRIAPSRREFDVPLWLGDAPLDGKAILLHAEQGLGDTLQFCRYAALVEKQGARVVLEVQPELKRLLSGLEGVDTLVTPGEPLPAFDYHCPLLSLPLALHTVVATIPGQTPYLFADAQASAQWRTRIEAAVPPGVLKVGLVWAGGDRSHVPELRKNDARRSLNLERLAPLLEVPGIQFFSLQKGEKAATQLASMRESNEASRRVIDWTGELTDFADTAALVDNLDLVISVDTSTAHLTGAMNKRVWILNRLDTCWRWMLERADTPWYASARIFRQPTLGDWDSVIGEIKGELAALTVR